MSARRPTRFPAVVPVLAATLVTAACGGASTPATDPARLGAEPWDAAGLFVAACASCHGPLGEGGPSGVPLDDTPAADRQLVIGAVRYGAGGMPASAGGMSDEQIEALAEYVAGLR